MKKSNFTFKMKQLRLMELNLE